MSPLRNTHCGHFDGCLLESRPLTMRTHMYICTDSHLLYHHLFWALFLTLFCWLYPLTQLQHTGATEHLSWDFSPYLVPSHLSQPCAQPSTMIFCLKHPVPYLTTPFGWGNHKSTYIPSPAFNLHTHPAPPSQCNLISPNLRGLPKWHHFHTLLKPQI